MQRRSSFHYLARPVAKRRKKKGSSKALVEAREMRQLVAGF